MKVSLLSIVSKDFSHIFQRFCLWACSRWLGSTEQCVSNLRPGGMVSTYCEQIS